VEESVQLAEAEIAAVFAKKAGATPETDLDTGFFGDVVGCCPLCGREVRRMRSFYGCSGYKEGCKFSVNTVICKRPISVSNIKLLLTQGKTAVISGFVSKSGKPFDAALILQEGRAVFDFAKQKSTAAEIPTVCPRCGRPMLCGRTAYGCSGYKEGCDFRIPFPE
jgi:DNA topoisomerase-3